MKNTLIFPAFPGEYSGSEEEAILLFKGRFSEFLKAAESVLRNELRGFDFRENNFLNDELKSQYISYIFSCTIADIITTANINIELVSGYSMGIYSALYYLGSVSFTDGLLLIRKAWDTISQVTAGQKFGMGMIIGLDEADILSMISESDDVQICNQNNRHTFIISGRKEAVDLILLKAREEGAMKSNPLPVSKPYHSHFLKATDPFFGESIRDVKFSDPLLSYVSAIDQRIIITGHLLKEEVIRNLYCRMNWNNTMKFMAEEGTDNFFECGAGDGLTRNSRFIEGNFKAFSISKTGQFLSAAKD